jgi:hypothetical protein
MKTLFYLCVIVNNKKKQIMENLFKVAKYEQTESGFNHLGYDEYSITYLKGTKSHELRIVVNGLLSNQKINLIDHSTGYKSQILAAISDIKNNKIKQKQTVTKSLKLTQIKSIYSNQIIRNIEQYLMGINKEESREILTSYELI